MAFLRQCLQEFRQRSGEHESWSALVGSVLDAETGSLESGKGRGPMKAPGRERIMTRNKNSCVRCLPVA